MTGPDQIPSQADILAAYNDLESTPLEPGRLVRFASLSRFDPRLAEMVVQKLANDWRRLDAFAVNTANLSTSWPAALGVISEHSATLLSPGSQVEFRRWRNAALFGVRPAAGEQFWIAVHGFAGKLARAEVSKSLKLYTRWGFYGRDWLRNKATSRKHSRTVLLPASRLKLLRELAESQTFFTLRDYLNATEGGVQRRTAELDLASASFLRARGKTRGRVYSLRKAASGKK